jgi:AcrR family transcriptional regulator
MKTQKKDRRSMRTQLLLGEALIALLLEKRYDDITIQDILDRANIGRSTFYEHYWDKEDLLTSEIERVIDVLDQHIATSTKYAADFIPSLALFQHVQEQHRLLRALLRGQGIKIVIQAFQDLLRARVEQRLREESQKEVSDELLAAVASYVAGAFMTLMQWWLETEMVWSPERMDALFRDLVLPGVDHLLSQEPRASPRHSQTGVQREEKRIVR